MKNLQQMLFLLYGAENVGIGIWNTMCGYADLG